MSLELHVLADADGAAARTAEVLAAAARDALAARGVAHLSLAGGSTPRRAYEQLGALIDDWSAVHLWFGDERCVGADDPESNYRMVAETLHATGAHIHRIAGELGAEAAASAYAAELSEVLGPAPLDLALLGLGEDGHTASLFPGHAEVLDREAICLPVHDAPKPPPDRVTLSMGVLLRARQIVLLAAGEGKREPLDAVLAGPNPATPASLLAEGALELIVDEAAHPSG
ncbi:MAG TPA: 6-phosphogluconolactonase [Solirubrobacteraceae bacterium]|nr:6-phosphogluconolactonase [Solirubrobacteraceae bacterium]